MSMPRFGFAFVPWAAPETLQPTARLLEDLGYDDFWIWEDCFSQSGLASAAVALTTTERLRVGIGLMPVPLRNVALTAMEIATLARLFPGRFAAGIGHGVLDWMGQAGVRAASPMTLLREQTIALRRLLAGEEVTMKGRYVILDRVKLDWPPTRPVPLLIGGMGEKTVRLGAELGDGVLFGGGLTVDEVREKCGWIADTTPDGKRLLPNTPREAVAALALNPRQDAPERIAQEIRDLATAGATAISFAPPYHDTSVDIPSLIRFLAEQVRPLLD
ncbi:MAG: LLM class flavin-dependent oxidoreductase [Promicromonosporaceae bacterium]|nr:LLM class flavin-dependent oxidoreductase [Promicromonosporaceae bacterium]